MLYIYIYAMIILIGILYRGTSYERQMTDATDTYRIRRDNRIIHSHRQLFFLVELYFPLVMILWPTCTRILYFEWGISCEFIMDIIIRLRALNINQYYVSNYTCILCTANVSTMYYIIILDVGKTIIN